MFNLFKKKPPKADVVDERKILDRICEETAKGHNSAFFYNANLSESAKKRLEQQKISVRFGDTDGIPFFEIFWKK